MTIVLNGTSGITNVDGTAAAPALTGTDTDTGIFFPAANTLAFSTNGTEDARFDSSGNLGIGTSSPGQKLEVAGTTGNTLIKNTTTTGANGFNASSTGGNFYFGVDASDGGFYNTGTAYGRALYSTGAYPMVFFTNATERMRLDSSGNLGIGTTSTGSDRLRVVGGQFRVTKSTAYAANPMDVTSFSGAILVNTNDGSGDLSGLSMYVNSSYGAGCGIFAKQTASNTADLLFYTGTGVAASNVERARIDSSGNLLVGTSTSPTGSSKVVFRQGGTSNPDSTWNASSWPFAVVAPEPALYLSSNIVAATGVGSATQTAKGGIGFRYVNAANPTELDIGIIGTSTVPGPVCFYNDTERARIDSSGNLLVGATSSDARLYVKGSGSTSSTFSLIVRNSASGDIVKTRDDGFVFLPSTYNNTSASAANVFMGGSGELYRSTSSLKYKTNVQDAEHGLADLLKLRSVTYEGKSENDAGKTFGGLIAEEVHAAGLTEFVQYAEDGTPDALAYGNMVSLCIKAIQEQQAIIVELKARLDAANL